jgi:hypothetical protein
MPIAPRKLPVQESASSSPQHLSLEPPSQSMTKTLAAPALDRVGITDPQQRAVLQGHLEGAISNAFAPDGWRAFEASERTTVYHEAGHTVMNGLAGTPVRHIWIKSDKMHGMRIWGGECLVDPVGEVRETSCVTHDLQFVRITLVGWLSECLFVPEDLRAISSIDEVMLASAVCGTIAFKAGRPHSDVFYDAIEGTIRTPNAHAGDVRRIAGHLTRCCTPRGPRPAALLTAAKANHAR